MAMRTRTRLSEPSRRRYFAWHAVHERERGLRNGTIRGDARDCFEERVRAEVLRDAACAELADKRRTNSAAARLGLRRAARRTPSLWLKSCSYPCRIDDFSDANPDARFLAAVFENFNVDFRIVVTTRVPAAERGTRLEETTPSRGWHAGVALAPTLETRAPSSQAPNQIVNEFTKLRTRTLARSCDRLLGQLEGLDPAFYKCAPYGRAADIFLRRGAAPPRPGTRTCRGGRAATP